MAVDLSGNVYIAEAGNAAIREVSGGVISTFAGRGTHFGALYSGPATNAALANPAGVAVDTSGKVYIADSSNNAIRKVSGGVISTIAGYGNSGYSGDDGTATNARLAYPTGVAVDAAGNVYIADTYNHAIREVSGSVITTIAGNGSSGYSGDNGPATGAKLNYPGAVAVDASGNVYIADTGNNVIRKVSGGVITTIAGNGSAGYSGDNGPATNAQLNAPYGVAVDVAGNVYIADMYNSAVRLLYTGSSGPPAGTAALSITSLHPGSFQQGQNNASYSLVVSNAADAGATSGTVSVTDTLPPGLTLVSMSGTGWSCVANLCMRNDVLAANSSYPPILVAVNVAANAAASVTNEVTVLGGGAATANGSDPTIVSSTTSGSTFSFTNIGSAANAQAALVPGSLATATGNFGVASARSASRAPYPTTLGGVSLEFGNVAAPLLYVSGSQITFQVPWELMGQSQALLTTSFNGSSATQPVTLASFVPAIYTTNGQGSGQGVIVNSANELVAAAHPSIAGTTNVTIYCSGLGPVTNGPATGSLAAANPHAWTIVTPSVTIGGVAATVVTSALAPGQLGVYAVGVQVPAGVAAGNAVPVVVSTYNQSSNAVTMAVAK
jgi:uncharacterized protein (TIGR03437 family)